LNEGNYKAALEGNNMWITGMKGMKAMTAKYHVLRYVSAGRTPAAPGMTHTSASIPSQPAMSWTADETYAWEIYKNATPEDKDYIRVFCGASPKGAALLPRSKVVAGEGAEHSLDCPSWISAKSKTN